MNRLASIQRPRMAMPSHTHAMRSRPLSVQVRAGNPPLTDVIRERLLDTRDDIELHYKRYIHAPEKSPKKTQAKPRLVILGSGWGAHSTTKIIDTDLYDVTVISPRNFFFFTPLLPSTAVGTIEVRSLVDPIRVANPYVTYVEARCLKVNPETKKLTCQVTVPLGGGSDSGRIFELDYDILMVAVGEVPADFGVKGVKDFCFFMKETEDALRVRRRIGECFELAAAPSTSEEERRRLLSFVVVGGGPTGVEFSGSLADYINRDLKPRYAALAPLISVTLLQSGQSILTTFQAKLQTRALDNLNKSGIDVRTGVKVVEVEKEAVVLGSGEKIPFGLCLWSAGNAPNPLTREIMASIPEQKKRAAGDEKTRGLTKMAIDPFQRVVGAKDILACGDATTQDEGERLPPTAQVASQQAAYIARLLNRGYKIGEGGGAPPVRTRNEREEEASPFAFLSLGIMAYIGNDRALIQGPDDGPVDFGISGRFALLLWSSVYATKQVSFRSRVLVLFDWFKTRVFGRDLSQL